MASNCANVFTPPTLAAPGRGLFPSEHRLIMFLPSSLVPLIWSSLDQSNRARVKEHRLSENTIWSGVPPSASTRTDQADPPALVCAFGEQRKLASLPLHYLAEPSSDRALRFHRSPEQRRPSTFYLPLRTKVAYSVTMESKTLRTISTIFSFGP